MAARKPKTATPAVDTAGESQTETAAQGTIPAELQQPTAPAGAAAETNEEEDMQNSIQNGNTMDHTPSADVKGGDLIVFANMVAVAITDIPSGTIGALDTVGVKDLPKGNIAFAQGQAVYTAADGTLSASSGENIIRAGVAWADAAGGDATVAVKINA